MTLLGWIIFIFALLFSIMLHEFGHFATAKKFRMKVTQFFVGFGQTLWSTIRGETEYGVKAIPAGGVRQDRRDDRPGGRGPRGRAPLVPQEAPLAADDRAGGRVVHALRAGFGSCSSWTSGRTVRRIPPRSGRSTRACEQYRRRSCAKRSRVPAVRRLRTGRVGSAARGATWNDWARRSRRRRARPGETGTRHRTRGQDRDRQRATAGCGTGAYSCSLTCNGSRGGLLQGKLPPPFAGVGRELAHMSPLRSSSASRPGRP